MFRPNTGTIYEWHLSTPRKDKSKPYSWEYLNLYGDNKRTDITMDWETKSLLFNYNGNGNHISMLRLHPNSNYLYITDDDSNEHDHILFTLDDTDYTGNGIIAQLDSEYYINFISYDDIEFVKHANTYLHGISADDKLLFIKKTDYNLLTFVTHDVLMAKTIDIPKISNLALGLYYNRGIVFEKCETLYCFPSQISASYCFLEVFPKLKTIIIKGTHTEQDEFLSDYAKEHYNINTYELSHIFENGDIIEKNGFGYDYSNNLMFK